MRFKPKILVVEDDPALLELLGDVLGQMGAEPRLVASSAHAAELIEREKFDGIFLDLIMPPPDGLELARRVRGSKSNATVPLVVITASPEPTAMQDSFSAGVNFFLHKPVTAQQLGKLLNAARGLMLEERRRYQRAPVSLLMRCAWGNNRRLTGQSVDLSASGVLLELLEPPPLGTPVRLEFSIPGHPQGLALSGRVVRQHSASSIGIQFEIDEPTRRRLMDFVDQTLSSLSATP